MYEIELVHLPESQHRFQNGLQFSHLLPAVEGHQFDGNWAWHAAQELGAEVPRPVQYARTTPNLWPGAALRG